MKPARVTSCSSDRFWSPTYMPIRAGVSFGVSWNVSSRNTSLTGSRFSMLVVKSCGRLAVGRFRVMVSPVSGLVVVVCVGPVAGVGVVAGVDGIGVAAGPGVGVAAVVDESSPGVCVVPGGLGVGVGVGDDVGVEVGVGDGEGVDSGIGSRAYIAASRLSVASPISSCVVCGSS